MSWYGFFKEFSLKKGPDDCYIIVNTVFIRLNLDLCSCFLWQWKQLFPPVQSLHTWFFWKVFRKNFHITQPAHRWITIVNVKSLTCPAPRLHHCLGCQFVTRNSWSHSNVHHHSSVSQWYCFLSISMLSNIIDCYLTNLEGNLEALGLKKFVEQHWLVASLFSKSSNPLLPLQIFSLTCFRYFTF